MEGAFKCTMRDLREGEVAKHEGQNTVCEASVELNEDFVNHLVTGELEASWKIDGTCCMIMNAVLHRRLDIRKGAIPPPDAVMGASENGIVKICWIPVNGTTSAENKWHLSAITKSGLSGFWSLTPEMQPIFCPWPDEKATYELIGPKIQANLYRVPEVLVDVEFTNKKVLGVQQIPRHYLVRHGDFAFEFPTSDLLAAEDKVAWFKDFILSHNVEGVVFRHISDPTIYYKVNRGHIGTPTKHSDVFQLNPQV